MHDHHVIASYYSVPIAKHNPYIRIHIHPSAIQCSQSCHVLRAECAHKATVYIKSIQMHHCICMHMFLSACSHTVIKSVSQKVGMYWTEMSILI